MVRTYTWVALPCVHGRDAGVYGGGGGPRVTAATSKNMVKSNSFIPGEMKVRPGAVILVP